MRADARRNRERLLDAAIEVILEVGADPPLDAIARRAEVGIATLYRNFPDRDRLLHAVAEHALDRSIAAAENAVASGGDGFDTLGRYAHDAVEIGVGVLNLVRPLLHDADWSAQRHRIDALLAVILDRGRHDGSIRPETRLADIAFAVIRFSRPLKVGLSSDDERALAHRHLDIYLDGLGTGGADRRPLPEPPVLRRWTI
jgi:AcrR family transcriptional regulator